jgi:hypothetical protein
MENYTLVDIKIPFWRLVAIFVKWAIAAIPATIIVLILYTVIIGILAAVFGAVGGNWPIPGRPT